jgi:DNA-directed RNA polymerase delta subunit
MIQSEQVISRNQEILFSNLDEEIVMLSMKKGEYYGLNSIASRIWELAETPLTFEKLITMLMKEYEVSREQCAANVSVFLERMKARGLIEII